MDHALEVASLLFENEAVSAEHVGAASPDPWKRRNLGPAAAARPVRRSQLWMCRDDCSGRHYRNFRS